MKEKFDIPVLLVTFNRPDNTKLVLEKIKEINPSKLYIFSDAPRPGNSRDIHDVAQSRSLFDKINPDCQVFKLFQESNLGCGPGVSGAINWVFQQEEMAIILEDDCVPNKSFFEFCKLMLLKFKDNTRVMHISGTRWNPEFNIGECDYFFSHIGHIWGWATWKRAWTKYDYNMTSWGVNNSAKEIKEIFKDKLLSQFWIDALDKIYKISDKHTWDAQWQYTLFSEKGLAVIPSVNLITNIGTQGMHTQKVDHYYYFRKTNDWVDRNIHFTSIKANTDYDIYHTKHHFLKKFYSKKKFWFWMRVGKRRA